MNIKLFFFLFSFISLYSISNAQTMVTDDTLVDRVDTLDVPKKNKKKKESVEIRQLRLSLDAYMAVASFFNPDESGFGLQADYNTNDKNYWVAEVGLGRGVVDYSFLKYTSNTTFLKVGLDRSLLLLKSKRDLDIAYLGLRYGIGIGRRSDADIIIKSPFGGNVSSVIEAQNYVVHWGEITFGMKLEVVNRLFLGWNGNAKFMLNSGVFKELAPKYVTGYGRGDKTTSFGVNMYVGYAIFRLPAK